MSRATAARLIKLLQFRFIFSRIANGHAFKHVIWDGHFPGVRTYDEFSRIVFDVMGTPTAVKQLRDSRTAYWKKGVIVIHDPNHTDLGTAFVPDIGFRYFQERVK
jgi:hypothetical protein